MGPDNNLWFTDPGTDSVGMITTAGKYTEYKLPSITADPDGIVTDPQDGSLWITEEFDGKIAEISTQGQVLNQYTVPGNFPQPSGITVGPDGNLWFAEMGGKNIGVLNHRQRSDHPIPRPGQRSADSRDHGRTRRQPLVHGSGKQEYRSSRARLTDPADSGPPADYAARADSGTPADYTARADSGTPADYDSDAPSGAAANTRPGTSTSTEKTTSTATETTTSTPTETRARKPEAKPAPRQGPGRTTLGRSKRDLIVSIDRFNECRASVPNGAWVPVRIPFRWTARLISEEARAGLCAARHGSQRRQRR